MRPTAAILFAVCLGLLAVQWSGVHSHINSLGFHGAAQGMHDHHHDHGDGNGAHDGDIDVRVVDYGLSAFKTLFYVFAAVVPLFLLSPARADIPLQWTAALPLWRRTRWRPPLRAPPHSHAVA